jgi:hypothetical protein
MGVNGIGSGGGQRDWEDGLPEDQPAEENPFAQRGDDGAGRLPLNEDDRLPWLESPDDVDLEEEGVDAGRIVGFVIIGVLALAVVLGAVYWLSHRTVTGEADGSLIEASKEPYKVKPEDAGGKVFEGTGDTSFKVSEGLRPQGQVESGAVPAPPVVPQVVPSATAGAKPAPAPAVAAGAAPAASGTAEATVPGVGVQIGAFSSKAAAEAAWSRYQGQYEALQGVSHRVVEGRADIGTVYRLQAVAGDTGAARSLCSALTAAGLKCQVK